jgi:hypothetical protein
VPAINQSRRGGFLIKEECPGVQTPVDACSFPFDGRFVNLDFLVSLFFSALAEYSPFPFEFSVDTCFFLFILAQAAHWCAASSAVYLALSAAAMAS